MTSALVIPLIALSVVGFQPRYGLVFALGAALVLFSVSGFWFEWGRAAGGDARDALLSDLVSRFVAIGVFVLAGSLVVRLRRR